MAQYKRIDVTVTIKRSAFFEADKKIYEANETVLTQTVDAKSIKDAQHTVLARLMAKYVELAQDKTIDKYTGVRVKVSYSIKACVSTSVSAAGVSKADGAIAISAGKKAARIKRRARQKARKAAARKAAA